MSKMDAQRAMREARYEQRNAGATRPAVKKVAPRAAEPGGIEPPAAAAPDGPLCGHRAISGRTCTRERGHAAKSHRYS